MLALPAAENFDAKARIFEASRLVSHERQKREDNEGWTFEECGGDREAEGFSSAGGEDDYLIFAFDDVAYHQALEGEEVVDVEGGFGNFVDGVRSVDRLRKGHAYFESKTGIHTSVLYR